MLLVIDNYDSFTYNLVQYLGELGADVQVFRNDKITLEQISDLSPERIVISPGPGTPKDAGISVQVIKTFMSRIPILGVCLGHQSLGEALGTKIIQAKELMHGKTSPVYHDGTGLFKNVENPFIATRYHSLIVDQETLSSRLRINAWTEDKTIMGMELAKEHVYGVQFHPESIMTKEGKKILNNFLSLPV
jgi:anthranilate synthase component 2